MRWIVAVDRTGIHTLPVRDLYSPYMHPDFIAEKCIYSYGTEYVAVVKDSTHGIKATGIEIIREHFPEAVTDHP